ncbi:MAG: LCP family protein [Acidimicrobiaceae bacterium]|nr:LCP family protein [Acidimicrobiaceae bacterium]
MPAHARHARAKIPRSRRRTWLLRGGIAFTTAVVVLVGAVVADYYYLGSLVHHKAVKHLQAVSAAHSNSVNILLIGSTSRCALTVQNVAYGLCTQGVTGVNADIDMIVHLNPTTGQVSLLSIPRDLFVPNARAEGANKIDAALYEGPSQLVAAIEEDFGIPINHYVELNFDTFASVVNALGGVKMYFPTGLFDAESGLDIRHAGCYHLDGYHALQVVRARHLQIQPSPSNTNFRAWPQEGLSDLARIRRTHEFLRVIAHDVSSQGLSNPITDQSLATAVLPDLTVDTGFTEADMVHLARVFAGVNISNVAQETFPVVSIAQSPYMYLGYNYGDVVFPVNPTGTQLINSLFGVSDNQSVFTGGALPAPGSFTVSVQGGAGAPAQVPVVSAQLQNRGFRVVSSGQRVPTDAITETVVWYGGAPPPANGDWKSPQLLDAESVVRDLSGPVIMGYDPAEVAPGSIVTVQTGTGLTVSARVATVGSGPAKSPVHSAAQTHVTSPTSSQRTAGGSATSTTTSTTIPVPSGIATNPAFGVPSATNPSLEWYDPRSCNSSGTGPGTF